MGGAERGSLHEGAITRARRDTWRWIQSPPFWLINVLLSAAAIGLSEWRGPEVMAPLFLGSMLSIVLLTFALQLARTPSRQRDEARDEVESLIKKLEDLRPRLIMKQTTNVEWVHHKDHSYAKFSISLVNRGESAVARPRVRAYFASLKDYAQILQILDSRIAATLDGRGGTIKLNMKPRVPHTFDQNYEVIVATIVDCMEGRFTRLVTINPKTDLPSTPTVEQARAFIPYLEKLVGGKVEI